MIAVAHVTANTTRMLPSLILAATMKAGAANPTLYSRNGECEEKPAEGVAMRGSPRPSSTGERHLGRAQPFEAHAAHIARLQVLEPGVRPAGHVLAGAHAALLAHHVHQHHSDAERIAGRVTADLLQHRRAVHRQRHLQLA